MGFSPAFEPISSIDTVLESHDRAPRLPLSARVSRSPLRFGGLSMDPITGAVTSRGRTITLPLEEREVLAALMRRAGQIIGAERLAKSVGIPADAVDQRVQSLRVQLKEAGVSCLPCRANGLGYVLWRC